MIGLVEAKVRATAAVWPHSHLLPRIPSAPGWARFKMTAGKRLESMAPAAPRGKPMCLVSESV